VGEPHGLDGGFFVEDPSEREGVFAVGATLYAAASRRPSSPRAAAPAAGR
jgi:hypothetical protein